MSKKLEFDIAETEKHLENLRTALLAIQPLITVDMPEKRVLKLGVMTPTSNAATAADLQAEETAPPTEQAASRRSRATKGKGPKRRTPSAKSAPPTALPATSGAFWASVLRTKGGTTPELVNRASAKLGTDDDAKPVLANRLSAWLYPAIKSGQVDSTGIKGKLKTYRLTTAA